ncbi:MAG: YitT family protein [Desulfotalea sp.]
MTNKKEKLLNVRFSIPWNLFLITVGSVILITGINGIILHHTFIPGGLYGVCLLLYYKIPALSPSAWYLLLNIPLLILGWIMLSRRFVLYSMYAVAVMTVAAELITIDFGITEQLYAAIAAGAICGTGTGIILRTLGSSGGSDVVAIILNQKFNIGVGKTFLIFNLILFSFVATTYSADILIASIILTIVTSSALDYLLTAFNQRKVVYVISDESKVIAKDILEHMKIGATFIKGQGAYSGKEKEILMTITNNIQLKRLEELVFNVDPDALFIVENSYDVIGSSFRNRKIY